MSERPHNYVYTSYLFTKLIKISMACTGIILAFLARYRGYEILFLLFMLDSSFACELVNKTLSLVICFH